MTAKTIFVDGNFAPKARFCFCKAEIERQIK